MPVRTTYVFVNQRLKDFFLGFLFLFLVVFGQKTLAQCTTPTGTNGSRCGIGAVDLTVAGGSKTLYNWYDASTGGNYLGSGTSLTTPTITANTDFYVAQYDTGSTTGALRMDGTNDHIAINGFSYSGNTYTEVTIETWIKTTDGTDQVIASFDRNRYWRLEINGNGAGTGQIGFDIWTNAGQLDFGGSIRVDDGNWHHVAAVYDNGAARIYVDGVLDNSTTKGAAFGNGSIAYGFIGVGSEATAYDGATGPNSYFQGDIDEFRIWSVAKTQAEIVASMNKCRQEVTTNLDVYYRFDHTGAQDSVIDASVDQSRGQLKNFTLPGAWINTGTTLTGCTVCESTRDAVTASLTVAPTVDLGVDQCTGVAVTLDAGPGKSVYAWSTGESTQTISVNSSGEYKVVVDSVGTTCQTRDSVNITFLSEPSSADTAICGPGTAQLSVTGGSGTNYYWYNQAAGGVAQGSGTTFTTPSLTEKDTFYVSSVALDTTRFGLSFDGVNDFVALNHSYNTSGQITSMTVEAWVKTNVTGAGIFDNWSVVDYDRSEYFNLFITGDNGRVGFSTADHTGAIHDFYSTATVNDNNWHHIAAVYDGTNKLIYIDGNLSATHSNSHGGKNLGRGTTRFGFLGEGSEAGGFNGARNNYYFQGSIGQVRVWSDARSITEIQAYKDECVLGSESNLEVSYKMDDQTGITLSDHSGNGRNGTLINMTNAAWINNAAVVNCLCGESVRDTAIVDITPLPVVNLGNDTCAALPFALDAGPNLTYAWKFGETSQTVTATASATYWVEVDTVGSVCKGRDTINVYLGGNAIPPTAVDTIACGPGNKKLVASKPSGIIKWYSQAVGGPELGTGDTLEVGPLTKDSIFYAMVDAANSNALSFDGTNDRVAIQNFFYQGSGFTTVTVEAWVKTTSAGNHIVASYDRSDYWRLELNGDAAGPGQVGFGIATNSGILDFGSTTTVNDGNWHHIAAVYDNGTGRIYIDGVLDATATKGTTWGIGTTRYGFIGTGSEATTYNGTIGPGNYFNGEIDEVRIWSTARTQAQLDNNKNECLTGNETGLDAYYRMSTGAGSLILDVANGNNGVINGSTWVDDAQGFSCGGACGQSVRVPITARVVDDIDSVRQGLSCPGPGGTKMLIQAFGGTGNFDYREIGGALSWSGSYSPGELVKNLPNGGVFNVEVKDENGCLDTIASLQTPNNPDNSNIASSNVTGTCLIPAQNSWFYISNATDDAIIAINPQGENLGTVSASLFLTSVAGRDDSSAYMRRSFVITPEFQPTNPVGVRVYFSGGDYSNLVDSSMATPTTDDDISSLADIAVTKYQGPSEDGVFDTTDATSIIFISQSASGSQFGQNYIEFQTPSFSEIWLHGSKAAKALPVELVYFQGQRVADVVELGWTTASEINSDYFVVERSFDGVEFEEIGTVLAQGFSSELTDYSFTDDDPSTGLSYYRLKQVDADGTFDYSQQIAISNELENTEVSQVESFPNPNDGNFFIKLDPKKYTSSALVQVFNLNGQRVLEETYQLDGSRSSLQKMTLPENTIPGIYYLKVSGGTHVGSSRLIIK